MGHGTNHFVLLTPHFYICKMEVIIIIIIPVYWSSNEIKYDDSYIARSIAPAHCECLVRVRLIFVCVKSDKLIIFCFHFTCMRCLLLHNLLKRFQIVFRYLGIRKSININRVFWEIFLRFSLILFFLSSSFLI